MFHQYAVACTDEDCPVDGDCVLIIGVQDDVEVWRSHWPADVPLETRISPDLTVEDRRGDEPVVVQGTGPTPDAPTLADEFAAYRANVQAAIAQRDEVDAARDDWLLDLELRLLTLEGT